MKEIIATFSIVTPMFIGGAYQTPSDGIRPPSIKGALRFWWRALNWGKYWLDTKKNEEQALQSLSHEEARLFGSSMGNDKGGQGCFLFSIEQPDKNNIETTDSWPPNDPNHTASYMAYGLLATSDDEHRFAIEEHLKSKTKEETIKTEFKLKILFKNSATEDDYQQINETLEAWSLFGGLGGRSRRAMGSITLNAIGSSNKLYTKVEYEEKVKSLLKNYNSIPDAPFTALSKNSLFHMINTGKNVRSLVEKAGAEYKQFRGQEGLRGKRKAPFGLPLQDVDMDSRRSSPLFFHIHELQNNNYASINLFLSSTIFHPDNKYKNTSLDIVKDFTRRGKK